MVNVVTVKGLVTSAPLLDEKNKPVTEETKFGGRKVTHTVHEHTQHKAGAVVDLDKALAKDLLARGIVREHVAGLDEDDLLIDPTKGSDPLA